MGQLVLLESNDPQFLTDVTTLADSANKSWVATKKSKSSEPWTSPTPKQVFDVRHLLLQTSAQVVVTMVLANLKRGKRKKKKKTCLIFHLVSISSNGVFCHLGLGLGVRLWVSLMAIEIWTITEAIYIYIKNWMGFGSSFLRRSANNCTLTYNKSFLA